MKTIKREKYLNLLRKYSGTDIVKVILGQRRVGKSVLLRQVLEEIQQANPSKSVIYLNKEHRERSHVQTREDLHDSICDYDVIGVDEIQEVDQWQRAIRDLQSKGGKDIYISGSNANMLGGELATTLGGRYISFMVYPLIFSEFCEFHQLVATHDSFKKYMQYGGLPYLAHIGLDDDVVMPYLKDIRDTIVLRDIVQRFEIKNITLFKVLMEYVAHNMGSIFSAKKIADYHIAQGMSVSPSTIIDYLNYAQTSMVLQNSKRYDIKSKKLFQYKEKMYFTDIGIRNAIVGGIGDFLGGVLEQIVHHHLLVAGWEVKVGDVGGYEVDFVCTRADETMYIQVAYLLATSETKEREYRSLLHIQDSWKKFVITMDDIILSKYEGIEHKNIIPFIQEL